MAETNSTQPAEEWRPAPRGYEAVYEVSSIGRVRRQHPSKYHRKDGIISPSVSRTGYYVVCLSKEGPRLGGKWPPKGTQFVHALVAEAFLGERPDGMQVNHKDGNKLNNHLSNLEYVTPSENTAHAWKLGLNYWKGESSSWAKLNRLQVRAIRDLHATGFYSHQLLAELFGVARQTVSHIVNNVNWKDQQEPPSDSRDSTEPQEHPCSQG